MVKEVEFGAGGKLTIAEDRSYVLLFGLV